MTQQTLIMTPQQIQALKTHYQSCLVQAVPYSIFRAKKSDVTITAYTSGKVLFQGTKALQEAAQWQASTTTSAKQPAKQSVVTQPYQTWTMIGSDEVGNGSYFGALTVCAVYLSPQQFQTVTDLGVKDSKLLSDSQIRHIAQTLKSMLSYHLTICNPVDYNRANQNKNANAIKAVLHNFTLLKLIDKLTPTHLKTLDGVLIDQFTPERNYLTYLANEPKTYTKQLYFEKKAESIHPAVACASIIARDAFLQSLTDLGKPYGLTLPSGAGQEVDQIGKRLVKQFGETVLTQTAKRHFANTAKILAHPSSSH